MFTVNSAITNYEGQFFCLWSTKTLNTAWVLGSFSLSDHLFEDGILLTTSFQFPASYSTLSSASLQITVLYQTPHTLVTYAVSIHYLWIASLILPPIFLLWLPQNMLSWTIYYRLLRLYIFLLLLVTLW